MCIHTEIYSGWQEWWVGVGGRGGGGSGRPKPADNYPATTATTTTTTITTIVILVPGLRGELMKLFTLGPGYYYWRNHSYSYVTDVGQPPDPPPPPPLQSGPYSNYSLVDEPPELITWPDHPGRHQPLPGLGYVGSVGSES